MKTYNHSIEVALPDYYNGSFDLNKIEGGYYRSLPLLIYYIMVNKGIYEELLTKRQLRALKKLIEKEPSSIYKMEEDKKDYDEDKNDLLKSLEYETIVYVGYRLKLRGHELCEYFTDQYPSQNIEEKYLRVNINEIKFDFNNQKDIFLKIIFTEIDKIILSNVPDLNLIQNLSLVEVLNIISEKQSKLNFIFNVPKKYHNNEEVILAAINNDCFPYNYLPFPLDSKDVVSLLIEKGKLYNSDFIGLSDVLKDDFDIAAKAVKNNASNIDFFSERLKNNYEIAKIALQQNGRIIDSFKEEFKKDKELVKIALKQNGYVFFYVSKYFENDKEMFLLAVQNLGAIYSDMLYNDEYVGILYHASDRLKDDEEVVMVTVKHDYESAKFISARLKNDISFVINMIAEKTKFNIENGDTGELDYFYKFIFKKLDPSLKSNKELFLKTISIDTSILAFATSKIKGDLDIGLEAIKNNINSISLLSPALQRNKKIIDLLQNINYKSKNIENSLIISSKENFLELLNSSDSYDLDKTDNSNNLPPTVSKNVSLEYASDELRNDYDVVIKTISKFPEQFKFASYKMRDNPEIAFLALKKSSSDFVYISERLKNDREFIKSIISENGLIVYHLKGDLKSDKELVLLALNKLIKRNSFLNTFFKKEKISSKLRKDPEIAKLIDKLIYS